MAERKSYFESCVRLMEVGIISPPLMPERRPRHDDEEPLGVNFYKSGLEDADVSGLTIPRTFIGRSQLVRSSFLNTNLSESTLCWNDFSDVRFDQADLSNSDLRASIFERVSFRGAKLAGADLRRSSFLDCDFTDADMVGATLTRDQRERLGLTECQIEQIAWADEPGEEPDGG